MIKVIVLTILESLIIPWKVCSCYPSIVWGKVHLSAPFHASAAIASTISKACLKNNNKKERELENLFNQDTCFPWLLTKLVQPCRDLGAIMSAREPRYLPSESYLHRKQDDDKGDGNLHLSTFPCSPPNPTPPIKTNSFWLAIAQAPQPPFWRSKLTCTVPSEINHPRPPRLLVLYIFSNVCHISQFKLTTYF